MKVLQCLPTPPPPTPHSAEDQSNFEINNPGAYSSVTIEFELSSLAVNSILESSRVNEAEGSVGEHNNLTLDDHMVGNTTGSAFDDVTVSGEAFKNVKLLLSNWFVVAPVELFIVIKFFFFFFFLRSQVERVHPQPQHPGRSPSNDAVSVDQEQFIQAV